MKFAGQIVLDEQDEQRSTIQGAPLPGPKTPSIPATKYKVLRLMQITY